MAKNTFNSRLCFLLVLFCCIGVDVLAQQRFQAGIIFGLNASQVDGDLSAGYNKLGIHGGLRSVINWKEKMDFSIELLYAQRGSYEKGAGAGGGDLRINLQYAEVPVVFSYKDWLNEEEEYYRLQASVGFSYGRLLRASAEGSLHDDLIEEFNDNDVSFTIGAEYFVNAHLSIGGRWSRSINRLFNNEKSANGSGRNSLIGKFLSFRIAYVF